MNLPNFLLIGVQKSGTTSVYNYLNQHPQIFLSPLKETNFLERDWASLEASAKRYPHESCYSLEHYQQLFADVADEAAIGEASPNYLFHYKTAIPEIKKLVPDAKLLVMLRNPVQRAYSDYLMHVRDSLSELSLEEHLEKRPNTSHTLLKGKYGHQLTEWFQAFPREQFKILFYEDLCQDAQKFTAEIYEFLNVDTSFETDTRKRAQGAQVPKNNIVNRLLKTENPVRQMASTALRQVASPEVRKKFRDQLIQLNSQSGKSACPLSPETKQALIEYYRSDVEQLQALLDRDLSSWLA